MIKAIVAGSNVKGEHTYSTCTQKVGAQTDIYSLDWLHLKALKNPLNSEDDIAGVVHSIGTNAQTKNKYSLGDRVAAFHPMMELHGAHAEYAVTPIHTVMKLPDAITFEGQY